MKMIALLIGLGALMFLVYAMAGDYMGIQKGDGEPRKLVPMQAAQEAAKISNQAIDKTNEAIKRLEIDSKALEK